MHACWTPDLTTNTQPVCVTGGTVGGGVEFHLVALYSPPVTSFVCDQMVIEEQTSDHPPQTLTITSFRNSSSLGCCSSPPPSGQSRALFCTIPQQTYSFHNADYKVTAYYHYMIMRPPPQQPQRVDGSISITVHFENLIVNAQPKILKWDPDNSANCDTTFSYSLASAQKKNCKVTIDIYSTEGQLVYETTLTQFCPGNYSFTWDGTAAGMPGGIAPSGLYTFDITVNGKTPDGLVLDYDKDQMRSQIVKVTQTSLEIEEDKYKFGYYIESSNGTLPSEAKVTVYGPAIDNFKQYWGPQEGGKQLGWNYVYFPMDTLEVGGDHSFVVVSGYDSDVYNKAHSFKPILERNQNPKLATAALFYSTYQWVDEGRSQQGDVVWLQVSSEQMTKWLLQCVSPALDLTSGAFYEPPPQGEKPKLTVFSQGWISKETKEKHPMLEVTKLSDVLSALQNVNVFAYAGHGDGNSIEFPQESDPEINTPYLSIQNKQLGIKRVYNAHTNSYIFTSLPEGTSFSNLHLVVIGSCRLSSVSGFPIVEAIVGKGAKFGIGVGGKCHLFADLEVGQYDPYNPPLYLSWNFLWWKTYKEWAKHFWKMVIKGDEEEQDWAKKWPTMGEAAKRASKRANDKELKEQSENYWYYIQRDGKWERRIDDRCVYVYTYGEDDYLGRINL